MRCMHPDYPLPLPFMDARDDDARCGWNARWWEPRLELTAPEGPA